MSENPSTYPSALLAAQRAAYRHSGAPSLKDRRADLAKLRTALIANRSRIEAAIAEDFGHRSRHETSIMELAGLVGGIDYLRKQLKEQCSSTPTNSSRSSQLIIETARPIRIAINRSTTISICIESPDEQFLITLSNFSRRHP